MMSLPLDSNISDGSALTKGRGLKRVSSALRLLGVSVLLGAFSVLLFQDWAGGADLDRFASLLGFTTLLVVMGVSCSRWLKENTGARLFVGLAGIAVVVNAAIAGALFLAEFNAAFFTTELPRFALWASGDTNLTVLAVGLSVMVLVPVSALVLRVLARHSAVALGKLFALTNALLLLPIRDANVIVPLTLVVAVWMMPRIITMQHDDPALVTHEGRFACALVGLPLGLMLARTLCFYAPGWFAIGVMALGVFLTCRFLDTVISDGHFARLYLNVVAGFAALTAAYASGVFVASTTATVSTLALPAFALVLSTLMFDLSQRCGCWSGALRWVASLSFSLAMGLNLLVHDSFITGFVAIIAGLMLFVFGFAGKYKAACLAGFVTAIVGLLSQLKALTLWLSFGHWGVLAVAGVAIVLLGSVIERHGVAIATAVSARWRRMAA